MKESILIVEDSKAFGKILGRATRQEFGVEPVICRSLEDLETSLCDPDVSYFAAVVDLSLPDAPRGEAVDLALKQKIPTIVLTASYDRTLRSETLQKDILDYLVKGGKVLEHIMGILRRIRINRGVKVLIVDDASTSRAIITKLLSHFDYQVIEARNGEEALNILKEHTDVKLVITDYHMPKMDGHDLVARIRQNYARDELAVIGLSSSDANNLTSQFLKIGANDFLYKGFSAEEFRCRVRQNIELVEQFEEIKEASNRDHLTGLYNRRYFYKTSHDLYEVCKRAKTPIAVAMIDLDHFKTINDTYGHEAGDLVLREVADLLKDNSRRSDVVARYGGEEFVFLATNISKSAVPMFFKRLCRMIEGLEITYGNKTINLTSSIGVVMDEGENFEDMLKRADEYLYQAKDEGRNRVIFEC